MDDTVFANPEFVFLVTATVITAAILLTRIFAKAGVLLWRSTLISYIVFVIFILMCVVYEHSPLGDMPIYRMAFHTLGAILLVPGGLIYGLVPGVIKPCPSEFDVFAWYTIGFLVYAIVIWGIMKIVKKEKENQI